MKTRRREEKKTKQTKKKRKEKVHVEIMNNLKGESIKVKEIGD